MKREAAWEKVPDGLLNKYPTVQDEQVLKHPKQDQKKFLESAFHTNRRDIFFEKNFLTNHFKNQ